MDLDQATTLPETQGTITLWGRETFGLHPAMSMAARCHIEMAELLEKLSGPDPELRRLVLQANEIAEAISKRQHELMAEGSPLADAVRDHQGAVDECADVDIVLKQVASCLDADLPAAVDRKMKVNRGRTWSRLPSGRHQHD